MKLPHCGQLWQGDPRRGQDVHSQPQALPIIAAEGGHQTEDWPMGIPLLGPRFSNRAIRGLSKRLDLSLLGLPRWEQLRRHLALQAPCPRVSTCLPAWVLCVRVGQSPWCARAHSTWPAPSGEEGLWATMLGDLLVRQSDSSDPGHFFKCYELVSYFD